MTDADLLIKIALACEGASEVPPNTNAGPFVERCLKVVGLPKGQPWCAAFVAMCGRVAFDEDWPLPLTGGCAVLGDFAKKKGWLVDKPKRGDLFLIWHPELGRFAHTGFCIDDKGDSISGNTSGAGSREGWIVGRRKWAFKPEDKFIRWKIA